MKAWLGCVCLLGACSASLSSVDGGLADPFPQTAVVQTGHPITSLAFAPAGDVVAVGQSGALEVWGVDGVKKTAFAATPGVIAGVAFSADGALLVSGGQSNALTVWNAVTSASLHVLTNTTFPVRALAINGNGLLVAATGDNRVQSFSAAAGTPGAAWMMQSLGLAFAGNATLVSGNAQGQVNAVGPSDGVVSAPLPSHPGGVLAVVPVDGARVLTAGHDGVLRLANISGAEERTCITAHTLVGAAYAKDMDALLGASSEGFIMVCAAGLDVEEYQIGGDVSAVAAQGSRVAVGDTGGGLRFFTLVH